MIITKHAEVFFNLSGQQILWGPDKYKNFLGL